MQKLLRSQIVFGFYLLLIAVALFMPDIWKGNRVIREINNLGHALVFFLLWCFVWYQWPWLQRRNLWQGLLVTTAVSMAVATAIELLQSQVGRQISINDAALDVLGAQLAYVYLFRGQRYWRRSLKVFLWLALAFFAQQSMMHMIDEIYMRKNFPVLADFSTPFEQTRWNYQAVDLSLTDDKQTEQTRMRVTYSTRAYAYVELKHFKTNWSAYKALNIVLYSEERSTIRLTLRIEDQMHDQSYHDRYNRTFFIRPGLNKIRIPLIQIASGPRARSMDLKNIHSIILFSPASKHPITIRIHKLFLN